MALSISASHVLDLLSDMRPINVIGHRFSGSEPAKEGALHFKDIVAIEVAFARYLAPTPTPALHS